MAAKKKPKPLPANLTGKSPGKFPKWQPPKGAGFLGNKPKAGAGLNANEVLRGANLGGEKSTKAQGQAQKPLFGQLANQQFSQIGRIAGQLNNPYTRDARGQVNQSFRGADQIGRVANNTMRDASAAGRQVANLAPVAQRQANQAASGITQLGGMLGQQARRGFASAGPTSIEQTLYDQGQADLALGRSLSPEQQRDATQAARQGFAARGMATGQGALGAELLSRDRYASQREAERRTFAATANNLREGNVMARREAAGQLATSGAGVLDAGGRLRVLGTQTAGDLRSMGADMSMRGQQIGGTLLNQAGALRQAGAGMMADLDPYQRAISGGLQLGQSAQQGALGVTQDAFGNSLDLYSNTGSFNINRNDSFYNSWGNIAAAVKTGNQVADSTRQSANITSAATRRAGTMGMIGAGVGAAVGIAGIGIAI